MIPCGCHDKACFYGTQGPHYHPKNNNCTYPDWKPLPPDSAKSFLTKPQPIILPSQTHLYRIVGAENDPYSSWWLYGYKLTDRSFWRTYFAVTMQMNSNKNYVDFFIPEGGLKVWAGPAASQQADIQCILPGGFDQIWIHPIDMKILKKKIKLIAKKTKWPFHTQN